jgi:hypothetical protein
MTGLHRFQDREPRPPTWAERERAEALRELGVEDVYVEPSDAPKEFWNTLLEALYWTVLGQDQTSQWIDWQREVRYATGWTFVQYSGVKLFDLIVRDGILPVTPSEGGGLTSATIRLSMVEHLLDMLDADFLDFEERVNERARFWRVGLRLEGKRFLPLASEHLHEEIVRPTLVLLSDARLEGVDHLYRKAFDRVLSGDPPGAITVATSSVAEMLRVLLDVKGDDLKGLTKMARDRGLIPAVVAQMIPKLYATRQESDAHSPGSGKDDLAMLAIHISGSIILYLGKNAS